MLAPVMISGAFVSGATIAAVESASSGFDPWVLISAGISPVAVVLLLLIGKLHTDPDYQRLSQYAETEHNERVRLQNVVNDRVLPMAHRQTLVMEASLPLVQAQVRLLEARDQVAGGG